MFEYVVPGDDRAGYCLAAGRFVLALAPELQPAISAIWPMLESPTTRLDDVFARIVERGVSSTPAFALAEIIDVEARAVAVVVHGRAVARVTDDPKASVAGAGLTTWNESTWYGIKGLMLGVGQEHGGLETLPVTGGVVRADWIRWTPEERVAEPGESAPKKPVVEPVETTPRSEAVISTGSITGDEQEPVVSTGSTTRGGDGQGAPPVIRLPDGTVVRPDFPLVFGRSPSVGLTERGAPTVPVVLESPRKTVSHSHLLVEPAGGALLLRDLDTRNGSMVRVPKGEPFVLIGGATALVGIGTTVELGDGVVLEVVAG